MERRHLLLAAMAAAAGLGAAGAAALVAGDDDARVAAGAAVTVTVAQTTTLQTAPAEATTAVAGVPVPPLVGRRLDEASQLLLNAGLDRQVDGGGLLGVLDDTAWVVCSTTPGAGQRLEPPATVVVHVDRSCNT